MHREMFDHPIWTKEPFTWAQAWVDLIGNANFKPNSFFIKDTEIHLERGQIAWSQITMCDRWQWSRGRVRRFLAYLEKEGMAVQQTGHLTTILTICNYNKYQAPDTADGTTDSTSGDTTGEHLADISRTQLNKDKNGKKEKNGKELIFDTFWDCYPGPRAKTNRQASLKTWLKIDSSLYQQIIDHVQQRPLSDPQWSKEGGAFIPGPAPFLNQQRWEDQWQADPFAEMSETTQHNIRVLQETKLT